MAFLGSRFSECDMVKVECHGCNAPYQIDERRIPPAGLKMRCPKCGTSLLVARPGQEAAAAAAHAAPPAPPAFAPPAPPPRPNPTGEWSGVDLPATRAPGPPPRPQAAPPPAAGGGFGEIDLNVDIPASGGGFGGGEVDLPVVPNRQQGGFGSLDFGGPESGGVDLPAVIAPRPAAPAGGFGSLDLGGDDAGAVDLPATRQAPPDPFGGVDLPSARPPPPGHAYGSAAGLPAVFGGPGISQPPPTSGGAGLPMPAHGGGGGFGSAGLPMPAGGGAGLPMPSGGMGSAGLPMPSGGGAGLPMPSGGGAGLPIPSGGGAGLPMPSGGGAGLPMPGGGGAGLPMPGGGGAGLPMPGGASLPMTSTGGLPVASAGGLPMPSTGGLPMTSAAGLPNVGGPGLPTVGGPGLPSRSTGGLPSPAGPGLPSSASHAGLPVVGTAGLPITSGPGLPSPFAGGPGGPADMFPSPTGMGLPSGAGSEMSFGEPGAFNVGSVDLQSVPPGPGGSGVGGEVELGASPFAGKGTPQKKRAAVADYDEPKRSRGLKIAGISMLVLGIAGGSMAFVDSVGPFGTHYIGDKLNAESNDKALLELRKTSQTTVDEDTLPAIVSAVDQAKAAQAERERHQDTKAYAAFLLNLRIIRFGPDGGSAAAAKGYLDGTDRARQTVPELLALASEDMLSNQLARARQHLDAVQQKEPDDVDALVLAGEIELISKEWAAAITAFSKAVNANKSARTLYGLARAQMAAGKLAEAEATAKGVLEASKSHVGARTLLATIAAKNRTREAEALALLNEITKDATIRAGAGSIELVDAYVALGDVQLQGSRFSQAQEAYAEALKLNPQSVPALIGSGELFYRSSRYSEAEARFESALRADPDNLDAKIGTAKTWLALERVKEAKDFLAKLQTAHPEDSRVFFWIARVSIALGNRKDAEGYYEQAIEKAKGPEEGVPAYVSLAALLAQTARANEANNKLVEAAKKYPESAELARARGDVAAQTGKYEEALNQYEQALKKNENDLQTRFQVGVTLRRMRKFDEAIVVFDKVESMDKDFPNLALERGLYYEETGQSDEALKMYKKALDKAPNDVDLKLRIGSTQVAAGAGKQAEPILKEVIRERSNSPEANHYLGRAMLLSKSNLNEAMRYLKRAVELDPNRAEYHLYVGWVANEVGQNELAASSLAKALELDSTMGDAYWQRGILQQKQGRNADAIKDLLTALEKRPSRYEAYSALAKAYGDQQNYPKAEEAWRNAIKGNDKVADWHYWLAKTLERKNDPKAAFVEFEKSVELGLVTEPKPGWLASAHFALGEGYRATDKDKAITNYKEYLRLAPLDDVYRDEATNALAQLKAAP